MDFLGDGMGWVGWGVNKQKSVFRQEFCGIFVRIP